jgi:copper chaperone NosL
MKSISGIFLALTLLISCSVNPEPLNYGKDACYTCKMTLVDKKFGAEIVTFKGKIYKFDDLNCMISFYNTGDVPAENIANSLVIDFANPETLIDAKTAVYVQSEEIRTPMVSQVAAFSSVDLMEPVNKQWRGKVLTWNELVSLLNRNNSSE